MSKLSDQFAWNRLESTASLIADVRAMVCKALDNAENRLLELWAAEDESACEAETGGDGAVATDPSARGNHIEAT